MNTLHTRFGPLDFAEDDIVTFVDGLIGFTRLRHFLLLANNPESPFRWLQSVDEPAMAFLVADPARYVDDYAFEIHDRLAGELGLESGTPPLVYTTASIPPGKPREMTLNLIAPIVVNPAQRIAKQVILETEAYTMKYRVFGEARDSEQVAA